MLESPIMPEKNRLVGLAGFAIVVAAGLRAWYAAAFEHAAFAPVEHAALLWLVLYVAFVAAYAGLFSDAVMRAPVRRTFALVAVSVTSVALVLLYPNFITTCLLVLVVWHITLATNLRVALTVTILQSCILALEKCTGQIPSAAMSWLVFVATLGFQLFAMSAAQLLRSEMEARKRLARANAELEAAQDLLRETAAFGERMRIARDLHDIIGHGLTVLAIQLDVAARKSDPPLSEDLLRIRAVAAGLLDDVRAAVGAFREETIDVRGALDALAQHTGELDVRVELPEELRIDDPTRAETLVRCVQEAITNALRHSNARTLTVRVEQRAHEILVSAVDDGRGGAFVEGDGLRGLRERFAQFGGDLSVDSDAEGFRLSAQMPLSQAT